jgi:hypothetical protein
MRSLRNVEGLKSRTVFHHPACGDFYSFLHVATVDADAELEKWAKQMSFASRTFPNIVRRLQMKASLKRICLKLNTFSVTQPFCIGTVVPTSATAEIYSSIWVFDTSYMRLFWTAYRPT